MSSDSDDKRWWSPAGLAAIAALVTALVAAAGLLMQNAGRPEATPGPVTPLSTPVAGPGQGTLTGSPAGGGPTSPPAATSTPVAGAVILASCPGCSEAETVRRQGALDNLSARIAVINDAACNDTTGTFNDGQVLARVGCSFSGAVDVDYALWPNSSSLATFIDRSRGQPGANVQTWFLDQSAGKRVGVTVEYLTVEGFARFDWTYEDLLISAVAQRRDGNQQQLNEWWRSLALLRAPS